MIKEISLRRQRAKLAKKIKENLTVSCRSVLLDTQLALLKRQYARLLEMEGEFEY